MVNQPRRAIAVPRCDRTARTRPPTKSSPERRALVTGASSRLGVETARVLGSHGAVVVLAARDTRKAREALDAIGIDWT
jgi:hypothetical protein